MTGVGRAGQQCVVAADLAREQHRVAVEGNERVFDAGKGLEIGGFRHTDGRTVEILAPDNIVGAFDLDKARIVGINRHKRLGPFSFTKGNFILVKIPVDAVGAASQIDIRDAVDLLAAENTDVRALIGHHGRVEDARHAGQRVAPDNGVFGIAPNRGAAGGRLFLPGHIRQCAAVQFYSRHIGSLLYYSFHCAGGHAAVDLILTQQEDDQRGA